jgi:signal transduction histidine kinase
MHSAAPAHPLASLAEAQVAEERCAAALDAALEEIRILSVAMSRDLRAPLRAITTHVSALLEGWRAALPLEARRLVFGIGTRALELDRLFQGLAGLAAFAQVPARFEKVRLRKIANEAWASLEPVRRGRSVTLEVSALPVVNGDRILLARALKALLENALKFTRDVPAARIELGSEKTPQEFLCFVRDNGVGFDPACAERLFEPFVRLRGGEAFEGDGLGLALVKHIVRRHGGRVWANGRLGSGAEFFFALPRGR